MIPITTYRSGKTYIATPGNDMFLREGSTAAEARAAVLEAVEKQIVYARSPQYFRAKTAVFVMYYLDGWWYDILRCDDDSESHPASVSLGDIPYHEALARLRAHLARYDG